MSLKIPAVNSQTGRNLLLQPLQIGGCGRCSTAAPATDRGWAEVQGLGQLGNGARACLHSLVNQLSDALVTDVGIGGGIKALKIHTGGGVHPAAATRAFLEQGTIGRDLEPRDCWLSRL